MARLGIVGFANCGKTTLFNALTGLSASTAPHPFSTVEPMPGVARIPDALLEQVGKLEKSAKVVPATLELLDLPALPRPGESSGGAGQYLGRLREMEALVMVLRAFTDEAVSFEGGAVDPVAQAEELLLELALADYEVLSRRAEKLTKESSADPLKRMGAAALTEVSEHLGGGQALRTKQWPPEILQALRDSAPLTIKPAVWVINVDEAEGQADDLVAGVARVVPPGDVVLAVSARLEEEASRLDEGDRMELFEGLGLGEGALALIVRAAHQSLGLISFYTVGPKESRAWTVRAGAQAPEAAGRIHSDLERGFIRAEVAPIESVIEAGGWDEAKRKGVIRVEGKAYEIRAGDTLVVRFSV
ncbi:MAG TPA: DUF933 domain-containing protein [Acidimicrobiia bacterium]|nr:DUF933 domain-containing protein [Acidimicrobiia bacterium]